MSPLRCSSAACLLLAGPLLGLKVEELPPKVVDVEYAVRGEIVSLGQELDAKLKQPNHGLPFNETVACNIGNPQALGQRPISFHREVLSLLTNPVLQESSLFPPDVHERARFYSNVSSFGAYSHSKGILELRKEVANFIDRRDSLREKVDPESIYLTDGASPAVKAALSLLINGPDDGLLIPIPQYPLYSAAITNFGGSAVGYYLDEANGWSVSIDEILAAIERFRKERPNGKLKGIVLINPGNPTGNVMSRPEMEAVLKLAVDLGIVVMADEVYQENIWSETKKWESFRKVAIEMALKVEVFSFHSISKGYYGECGLRGGFMQLHNVDKAVQDQLYKMVSLTLCANTLGQAMTASIMNPPAAGSSSFDKFAAERTRILESLKRKSAIVYERLRKLPGMDCQPSEGAMYAFPSVDLPPAALKAAEKAGKVPDVFYCIELLKATGIIVVPGSGFHQRPGTWHFRITILPAEEKLPEVLDRLASFHEAFMKKYASKHVEL